MKTSFQSRLLALAAGLLLTASAQGQTTTWSEGDLILGFRSTDGSNSLLVNVGPASQFTLGNSFTLNIGTLSPDLESVFGANWFTRIDPNTGVSAVRISFFGSVRTGSGPSTVTTLYTSNPNATPFFRDTSSGLGPARSEMVAAGGAYAGNTPTGNPLALIQANNATNSYASFQDPGPSFGRFNPSNEVGTNQPIYLNQLISGAGASALPGNLLGTISLDSTGTAVFAVPEPSTYLMGAIGAALLVGAWRRRRLAALA